MSGVDKTIKIVIDFVNTMDTVKSYQFNNIARFDFTPSGIIDKKTLNIISVKDRKLIDVFNEIIIMVRKEKIKELLDSAKNKKLKNFLFV